MDWRKMGVRELRVWLRTLPERPRGMLYMRKPNLIAWIESYLNDAQS